MYMTLMTSLIPRPLPACQHCIREAGIRSHMTCVSHNMKGEN